MEDDKAVMDVYTDKYSFVLPALVSNLPAQPDELCVASGGPRVNARSPLMDSSSTVHRLSSFTALLITHGIRLAKSISVYHPGIA